MNAFFSTRSKSQGFTLVELSIVLVILALVIGGVLIGAEVMHSANLRATIHQMESYQSAMNNFRSRFRAIPGDFADATSYFASNSWPATANGDGDTAIEDDDDDSAPVGEYSGEVAQFWYHLNAAGMIDGRYDAGNTLGSSFPIIKLGKGGIIVGAVSLTTQPYNVMRFCAYSSETNNDMVFDDCLTPEEAYSLDNKLDDGHPLNGMIEAVTGNSFGEEDAISFDQASVEAAPSNSFAELLADQLMQVIIPAAHAETNTWATEAYSACLLKDQSLGTVEEQNSSARYAVSAGATSCQLRVFLRF